MKPPSDLAVALREWFAACGPTSTPRLTPVLFALRHRRQVVWPVLRELGLAGPGDDLADATETFLESLFALSHLAAHVGLMPPKTGPWLLQQAQDRAALRLRALRRAVGLPDVNLNFNTIMMLLAGGVALTAGIGHYLASRNVSGR